MERYELDEWDPQVYNELYYARQKFNRRVKPKNPGAGKWYAVYCEGPKKGKAMPLFDPQAKCVMYAHKTSKLAEKVELRATADTLSKVPLSLELIPKQFSDAGVQFWTPEMTNQLKIAANAIEEVVAELNKELELPKAKKKKVTKKVKEEALTA